MKRYICANSAKLTFHELEDLHLWLSGGGSEALLSPETLLYPGEAFVVLESKGDAHRILSAKLEGWTWIPPGTLASWSKS
jgi:hypothetical protein